MNKSKEVLYSLTNNYITNLKLCNLGLQNNTFDENIKKAILLDIEETAGKLMLACKDLKKEMEK